jgi:hypothetical protein
MADEVLETTGSETGSLSNDVDELSEGSEEPKKVEESPLPEEEDEPTEETPEEEAPEVEEEEEENEEEVSDEEQITRPSWKTIKEKYPELAKDKDFKNVFFRDKEFTQLFPTVQDAKDSFEKSQLLDYLDGSISTGDPTEFIKALAEPTRAKFAQNILPTLHSLDRGLFKAATQPLIFEMLNEIHALGEKNGDENLQISVKNIAKILTGKFEVPPRAPKKGNGEVDPEKQELQEKLNQLATTQKQNFYEKADRSIKKQLIKTIEEGLDPKNELSDFTKQALIDKILDETRNSVSQDQAFASKMKHLAKLAEKAGYPPDYMPRFISAYLGRAKQLALTLRAKHKSAAIGKGPAKSKITRVEGSKDTSQIKNVRGKVDYSKMSDEDILNS